MKLYLEINVLWEGRFVCETARYFWLIIRDKTSKGVFVWLTKWLPYFDVVYDTFDDVVISNS